MRITDRAMMLGTGIAATLALGVLVYWAFFGPVALEFILKVSRCHA